jgi:hypothetical protein
MHVNETRPPDRSVSESPHLTYPARPTILVHLYPAGLHCLLGDHLFLTASRDIGQLNPAPHGSVQHLSMNADTTMQPARGAADVMEALLVSQRGRHFVARLPL